MRISESYRLFFWTATPLLVGTLMGCETTGRLVEKGGDSARRLVGGIEPTGVVSDTTERKELMKSARLLVDSLDRDALKKTVADLQVITAQLSERIDAVSAEDLRSSSADLAKSLSALRSQIEAARVEETLASARSLAVTADERLDALDVEAANAILEELHGASSQLSGAIEQLKDASSQVLERVDDIGKDVQEMLQTVPSEDVLAKVDNALADIQTTSAALPPSAEKLKQVLGTLRLASQLAVGVLAILTCCLIAWLFRLIRPRPAL